MAAGSINGDLFATPEFWEPSKWLDQPPPPGPSFFDLSSDEVVRLSVDHANGLQATSSPLLSTQPKLLSLAVQASTGDGLFRCPFESDEVGGALPTAPLEEATHTPKPLFDQSSMPEDLPENFWLDAGEPPSKVRRLRTWDTFDSLANATPLPFITEAGPSVYDALLMSEGDPLQLHNSDVPVVQTGPFLESLLALALNRESILFRRDGRGAVLKPVMPQFRISGYSAEVLAGLMRECGHCGVAFGSIQSFVREAHCRSADRCSIALASAIGHALEAVESHVSGGDGRVSSVLQLQATIRRAVSIISPLQALVAQINPQCSEKQLLSLLFKSASHAAESCDASADVMCELLRRASRPWLALLEEWLGIRSEGNTPFTKLAVGETRGFVKVGVQTYVDDFGLEEEEIDFQLDWNSVPDFMAKELAQSVFEIGRNIRFVKSSQPEHVLLRALSTPTVQPPSLEWAFDLESVGNIEKAALHYQRALRDALNMNEVDRLSEKADSKPFHYSEMQFGFESLGYSEAGMNDALQISIQKLDGPIYSDDDNLRSLVRAHLGGRGEHLETIRSSSPLPWPLISALSFGPITRVLAHTISRESMRLLFGTHGLRDHLRLQNDYQLLGNGLFRGRLSDTLFDPDLETAERQAGVARRGGVMGLRLNGRDTWPPASSELRLALMGLLTESYAQQPTTSLHINSTLGQSTIAMPGDLSFAVRDLSSEEVDKCMDADSLEALDFLRLSYKPPAELSSVMTPLIMMKYDRVFKQLLRLLRLAFVTNMLLRQVSGRHNSDSTATPVVLRYIIEARHFVNSMLHHFLGCGIKMQWDGFERDLNKLEAQLGRQGEEDASSDIASPDQLRELHSKTLDDILAALFLKKRQQPVSKLLDEIFRLILSFTKELRSNTRSEREKVRMMGDAEASVCYRGFRKKVETFIKVCHGLAKNARESQKGVNPAMAFGGTQAGDRKQEKFGDIMEALVMSLDTSKFYIK